MRNKTEAIAALLKNGCLPDSSDSVGNSLFHWVNNYDTFSFLVKSLEYDTVTLHKLMTCCNNEGVSDFYRVFIAMAHTGSLRTPS